MSSSTQIPKAQLGKDGPTINRQGLGCMGLSAFYGSKKSDDERLALLDKAYALGQTFWDSADAYQDNEDLLGKWFATRGKRDEIFLATKFANKVLPDGGREVDSTPEYCKTSIAKSLTRLGVDHVDLYYCHRLDGKTPVEKTVAAMAELQKEGKIRYIGLSECSAESLRRAHAVHPITAVQIEYSPFALDIESPQIQLLKTARELGIAVVAYSPIGRGMLSGEIKSRDDISDGDWRKNSPRFSEENFPKNFQLVQKIVDLAKTKGVTPAQLTLAWLMAQGDDIFPIPGTTRQERLVENVEAVNVKLSKEEIATIRHACESTEVHGARYPPAMAKALFADTPPLKA